MEKDIQNGYVTTETHKGITTIEFFHPQSNALPQRILEILANEIHAAGSDPDTTVIVLRAGGDRTFCAGAAFDELAVIENEKQGFNFLGIKLYFLQNFERKRICPNLKSFYINF